MKEKVITFRLSREDKEILDNLCKTLGVKRSELIIYSIRNASKMLKEQIKNKPTGD